MTQIEQIRAEIERRLFEISNHDGFIGCVKTEDISNYKTLRDILDFIESLEKEEMETLKGFAPGTNNLEVEGRDYIPVAWVETLERYGKWKIIKVECKQ